MTRTIDCAHVAFRVATARPNDQLERVCQAVNAAIPNEGGIAEFRQQLQQVLAPSSSSLSEFPRSDVP